MIFKGNKSSKERMEYFKGQDHKEENVLEAALQVIPVVLLIALILYATTLF